MMNCAARNMRYYLERHAAPLVIGLSVAGLSAAGCGGPERQAFRPLERTQGRTVDGYAEALYDLSDAGRRFGEAKVSSRGAYTVEGYPNTLIHVGFDIENGSNIPITLDPSRIRLESVQTEDQVLQDVPVSSPAHVTTVQPNSTGHADLTFSLPPAIDPNEVRAFRVAWAVSSNGQQFTEFTPFASIEPKRYYVPVHAYYYPYYSYHYPFYDPFWGPDSRIRIIRHYPRVVVVRPRKPAN